MSYANDPEGTRLPIKVDSTSNGEFLPRPLDPVSRLANRLAQRWAGANAKRAGKSRRSFLVSLCGAASTLLAFNRVHAATGAAGGFYDIDADAAVDDEIALAALGDHQFIFDIQGHHVSPDGQWRNPASPWKPGLARLPNANCAEADPNREFGHLDCFSQQAFIKDIFLDSDTDVGVLTFVPTAHDDMPLTVEEAVATREIVDAMEGSHRLLIHGRVIPTLAGDVERMDELREKWRIAAWKTYTQFGPGETGYWLDDQELGLPFVERVRASGTKVICVHKGLPLVVMGKKNIGYSRCRDIGPAARQYPDVAFMVYHAGFDPAIKEGPFEAGSGKGGIDSLIQSLLDEGLGRGSNVYAELGSTWRYLMRDPVQAAHGIGKLLKYVGEDNVVWGTDSIWYGSPQDQIQAFRTFQISDQFAEEYGYPKLTPEIRAKVFGLNAARPYGLDADDITRHAGADPVGRAKRAYLERPDPSFVTYGPRNRREFLALARLNGAH